MTVEQRYDIHIAFYDGDFDSFGMAPRQGEEFEGPGLPQYDYQLHHSFVVEISDEEAEQAFSENHPTGNWASGYFNEYMGFELYNPEKWEDMTEEQYELAKKQAKRGRDACRQAGLTSEGTYQGEKGG